MRERFLVIIQSNYKSIENKKKTFKISRNQITFMSG